MSIPNNHLKTDNQRLAFLCLVEFGVYDGLSELCGIVGSRLARALGLPIKNSLAERPLFGLVTCYL
ncbi:hypothetical protein [Vibrio sp. Isolate24]|uniref:hypothetical protein n=1 Tax=Vibrio sp. Isolate24 TaxID=2908534 RepID=UPI001EFDB742|nr:hypothetical protein [Vibrio sp. Isolate24]MCG9680875.1 hypothetical protein [Vibrio sp. Isolate24]